jgi:acetyl-CoA C-acetyltransferase
MVDSIINDGLWDIYNNYHMGVTAENLQLIFFNKRRKDAFAAQSQNKAESSS